MYQTVWQTPDLWMNEITSEFHFFFCFSCIEFSFVKVLTFKEGWCYIQYLNDMCAITKKKKKKKELCTIFWIVGHGKLTYVGSSKWCKRYICYGFTDWIEGLLWSSNSKFCVLLFIEISKTCLVFVKNFIL